MVQEYHTAQKEYTNLLKDAKTDEEKKEVASNRPLPADYAKKMMAIAEKYSKDDIAFDALLWVRRTAPTTNEGAQALDLLTQNHITNPRAGEFCSLLTSSTNALNEKTLRAILEQNPHKNAQGFACYYLAMNIKSQVDAATRKKIDAADLSKQVENLLDRVTNDFGEIKQGEKTLAQLAEPLLFELRFLAVGKTAPDIDGEDIDGKTFKLSDYRGKVVMLDFWGHW